MDTFSTAYDAVLRGWPVAVRSVDVPTTYGATRVQVCGPEDGAPLVLLPGGGVTSLVWSANVAELSRGRRVFAVDLMGDIGRSVRSDRPLRECADLMAWLDELYDGLGLTDAQLCGHSYGAWIALNYALHAPARVARLALLEPTGCFAGLSPRYLLHGLPQFWWPSPERGRAFFRWETGGSPADPVWQSFLDGTAEACRDTVLAMRRPKAASLRACEVPTLVVLAGRSRAHDVRRVAEGVGRLLPQADVVTLPDASHHSIPTERPEALNRLLAGFLTGNPAL